jgi:diguanylate cyclase (GGDEF)-like protein/PAS domain S-box-containing protein
MRKLAADQKLMACLATILLMIAMLGVVSNSVLSHINETFKTAVDSTARKLWLAGDINMAAGNMLAAQRRTILYADTPWAAADARIFEVQAAQVDRDIAELKSLPVNLEELRIIDMVEDSHASYRRVSQHIEEKHVFDLWDRRNEANAYAGIDDTTDQLEIVESNHLKETLKETQTKLIYGRMALSLFALVSLLVVILALHSLRSMTLALRSSVKRACASEVLCQSIMDSMPCVVCIFDLEGNLKRWNNNFLGYPREEILQKGVMTAVEPSSHESLRRAILTASRSGKGETEAYLTAKDGRTIPAYLTGVRFSYGGEICILGVGMDISRQKTAEQYGRLQRVALEEASEAIVITDANGSIEWANHAFTALTGYELEEVLGVNPRLLKSGMMDRTFYKLLWTTILKGEKWSGELWNLKKDGNVYCEEMHIAPVRAVNESISNFVAVKHDITERKQLEAQAQHAKEGLVLLNKELREANENILRLSQTDSLTGLANRRTIDERMGTEIARAERLGCGFSVILGDLDHFKSINDQFGHLVGDRVLVAAAVVLGQLARPYDLTARFGGEEFMVLLPESTLADAMTIAQRIRKAICEVAVPGVERLITMSLGISTWGRGDSPRELIGRADVALYQAKRRGRNRVVAQTIDMPPSTSGQILAGESRETLLR